MKNGPGTVQNSIPTWHRGTFILAWKVVVWLLLKGNLSRGLGPESARHKGDLKKAQESKVQWKLCYQAAGLGTFSSFSRRITIKACASASKNSTKNTHKKNCQEYCRTRIWATRGPPGKLIHHCRPFSWCFGHPTHQPEAWDWQGDSPKMSMEVLDLTPISMEVFDLPANSMEVLDLTKWMEWRLKQKVGLWLFCCDQIWKMWKFVKSKDKKSCRFRKTSYIHAILLNHSLKDKKGISVRSSATTDRQSSCPLTAWIVAWTFESAVKTGEAGNLLHQRHLPFQWVAAVKSSRHSPKSTMNGDIDWCWSHPAAMEPSSASISQRLLYLWTQCLQWCETHFHGYNMSWHHGHQYGRS